MNVYAKKIYACNVRAKKILPQNARALKILTMQHESYIFLARNTCSQKLSTHNAYAQEILNA